MARDFEGYCPDTIGTAAADNPALAEALLQAHETGAPGICAALIMSREIFTGDRAQCTTPSDCIFLRN